MALDSDRGRILFLARHHAVAAAPAGEHEAVSSMTHSNNSANRDLFPYPNDLRQAEQQLQGESAQLESLIQGTFRDWPIGP